MEEEGNACINTYAVVHPKLKSHEGKGKSKNEKS